MFAKKSSKEWLQLVLGKDLIFTSPHCDICYLANNYCFIIRSHMKWGPVCVWHDLLPDPLAPTDLPALWQIFIYGCLLRHRWCPLKPYTEYFGVVCIAGREMIQCFNFCWIGWTVSWLWLIWSWPIKRRLPN